MGPRVARRMHDSDQREELCCLFHLVNLKRRANARPTRNGPVRQDISFPPEKIRIFYNRSFRGETNGEEHEAVL